MQTNWKDISYLKTGNKIQISAYNCLKSLNIFECLKEFDPLLTGTIPIGINIKSSDLDIICNTENKIKFVNKVEHFFSFEKEFSREIKEHSVVFSFLYQDFIIEIYGEPKDVFKQNAYLHMISEYRLLKLANAKFKQQIINLKHKGYKTEPAFGKLLNLKDPYKDLIKFNEMKDDKLIKILTDCDDNKKK